MAIQVRTDPRLAGQVTRYHTWPRTREQSVGEHTWQMLRLTYKIWDGVPPHVIEYLVHHDTAEIAVGDIPFPVKRDNPSLKLMMDRLEEQALKDMDIQQPEILPEEYRIIKYLELLEMAEWGMEEIRRGNQFAELVMQRCISAMEHMEWEKKVPGHIIVSTRNYLKWRKEEWHIVY